MQYLNYNVPVVVKEPNIKNEIITNRSTNSNNILNIIAEKIETSKYENVNLRAIYHYINNKYWTLSIIIIILSSILTIVESVKLIFVDSRNKYLELDNNNTESGNRIIYSISKHSLDWNLSCDIMALFIGSTITLIMSLIRFNKYQIKLELISNRLMLLRNYNSSIKLLKYKVENTNYNINDINAEIIKMEESIAKDCEMDKILSENKERELMHDSRQMIDKGPYRSWISHTIMKYICCKCRIESEGENARKDKNIQTIQIGSYV